MNRSFHSPIRTSRAIASMMCFCIGRKKVSGAPTMFCRARLPRTAHSFPPPFSNACFASDQTCLALNNALAHLFDTLAGVEALRVYFWPLYPPPRNPDLNPLRNVASPSRSLKDSQSTQVSMLSSFSWTICLVRIAFFFPVTQAAEARLYSDPGSRLFPLGC